MLTDKELLNSMLQKAQIDNQSGFKQSQENLNQIIKITQIERLSDYDAQLYLSKLNNNMMTLPTLEVLLSILRLYSYEKLGNTAYLSHPQAFSIVKDIEEYMVYKTSCILYNTKESMVINESKIHLMYKYLCKKLNLFFKVCHKFKKLISMKS